MALDEHELRTETFSNARGWTAVRVTHEPTNTVAERLRTEALRSAVQAQRECVEELRRRVGRDQPSHDQPSQPSDEQPGQPGVDEPSHGRAGDDQPVLDDAGRVSRAEFDALAARVAALEHQLQRRPRR